MERVIGLEHFLEFIGIDCRQIVRKILPGPTPGPPSPAAKPSTEMVVIWMPSHRIGGKTGYPHDALIVFVTLEQFCAKGEKIRMGYAIIFENDAVLDMLKKPVNG